MCRLYVVCTFLLIKTTIPIIGMVAIARVELGVIDPTGTGERLDGSQSFGVRRIVVT